ncbi:MAG: hypothetical protein LUD14_06525 [Clostridiales bacterium]|nr:hypothetical protein [Clostridiales bacterium]
MIERGEKMVYCYDIKRENAVTGQQSGFTEIYTSDRPLVVGSLVLLPDRKCYYRVLKKVTQFESFEGVKS